MALINFVMSKKGIKEILHIKYAIILIGVIGFIIFILIGEKKNKLAEIKYHELAIKGIVEEIKYFDNYRGTPSFYINGAWHNFDLHGHRLTSFTIPKDSLVKKSGSDTIQIYRKNEGDEWELIIAR
jgi:hypothetical protein